MGTDSPNRMTGWRRAVVGSLSLGCLAAGAAIYFFNPGSASGLHGILIRSGTVLGAIWLAMPQLGRLTSVQSAGAFVIAILLIVAAASRPSFFRVIATLLVIGLILNWAMRWLGSIAKNRP